eukprot:10686616-Ditylum_brightwellii.AAC.1
MSKLTVLLKTKYPALDMFGNEDRNQLVGNGIGEKISYSNLDEVNHNCLEGNDIGFKSASNPYFNSRIDRMNSKEDEQH